MARAVPRAEREQHAVELQQQRRRAVHEAQQSEVAGMLKNLADTMKRGS